MTWNLLPMKLLLIYSSSWQYQWNIYVISKWYDNGVTYIFLCGCACGSSMYDISEKNVPMPSIPMLTMTGRTGLLYFPTSQKPFPSNSSPFNLSIPCLLKIEWWVCELCLLYLGEHSQQWYPSGRQAMTGNLWWWSSLAMIPWWLPPVIPPPYCTIQQLI